ncbi:MAG: SDR family NAD(P)-dependent oxidoreductase [Canibacter sp.]
MTTLLQRSTEFTPERALITGASAGLGHAFATRLGRQSVDLVLVARNTARLERLKSDLESQQPDLTIEIISADLATDAGIDVVRERLSDRNTPIDLLINNAGFGLKEPLDRSSLTAERQLFDVLAWAPLALSHSVLPVMLERQRGWILNVASLAGFLPSGTYAAAKSHTIMLARSINAQYRARGIVASALCPGFVRTEFHQRMALASTGVPWFAWAKPSRIVRDALRGLAAGKTVIVSDFRYRLIRPLLALVPDSLIDKYNVLHSRSQVTALAVTEERNDVPKQTEDPSIKDPELYEELRKDGNSKEKSARIANAAAASSRSKVGRTGGKSGSYDDWTKDELYRRAQELEISGRSKMNRDDLIHALRNH